MKLLPLCMLALPLSWIVWYINFSGESAAADTIAQTLRNRINLPSPEKLHVIVTGASGYLGHHTCQRLLNEGHAVTAVDVLSHGRTSALLKLKGHFPTRFSFHNLDLGDREELHDLLTNVHPKVDSVIHLAGLNSPAESLQYPLQYYRNNTVNTIQLLEVMKSAGINKMVFGSSSDVYGSPPILPVPETSSTYPTTPLGDSKLGAENTIRALARADPSFQAVILRLFQVYGEGQLRWHQLHGGSQPFGLAACLNTSGGSAVIELPAAAPATTTAAVTAGATGTTGATGTSALETAATGEGAAPGTTGAKSTSAPGTTREWLQDWVYISDAVEALAASLHHMSNPVEVYNVASGVPVSGAELAEACHKATGVDVKVVERQQPREGDEPRALYADISKIANVMSWRPNNTDFQACVVQTLQPSAAQVVPV